MSESPLHGFRGDTATPVPLPKPRGVTIAITREAGGRGSDVAAAVGERLGWQVFAQETLDQLVNDTEARKELLADLPAGAGEWADHQLNVLLARRKLSPVAGETARLIFALAARGEAVVIGRGAGFILPAETTLHVRIIAPRAERIAYLADWMRLPPSEAEVEVRARDDARVKLLAQFLDGDPDDPLRYDLVLNSSRLGLEGCTAVIVEAAASRHLDGDDDLEPV